jgi:putative sugar O-methyltransferase
MRHKTFRRFINPRHAANYLSTKLSDLIALHSKNSEFIGISENRSASEYGDYVSFVARAVANPSIFSEFKSHPSYRAVLEHVTPELGEQYLAIINEQNPDFIDAIDRFKINDRIGTPITHSYAGIGTVSPATLRYIKVASDLKTYFGSDIGKQIAEIGVGYGGQLLINDQVFKVKQYHLYDLPPVLNLVERYLESHILNCSYKMMTLNQSSGDDRYDLVISNYAFSELPSQLQCKYIEKVLSKSSKGYLTMNSGVLGSVIGGNQLSVDDLRKALPSFEVFAEAPITAPNNYVIVWGRNSPRADLGGFGSPLRAPRDRSA